MIHIGSLIEQELRRQDRSVTWFAAELRCDRTKLEDISVILQHNFFLDYAEEVNPLLR